MRKTPLALLALLAVVTTSCGGGGGTEATTARSADPVSGAPTTTPKQSCAVGFLEQFTTRQKLAQLLTVGVTGTADALQVVRTEQVGGVFIGGWTERSLLANKEIEQVKAAAKGAPLLVSIDEEGGRVSRVRDLIGPAPAARTVPRTMSADKFYTDTLARGRDLKGLGITVNFAPDVDVSSQPDDSVIGDRSFSSDPQVVTEYAGAYIRAMNQVPIGTVIKHFPGHGSGSGDSHQGAVRTPPLEQLKQVDLAPFRDLIGSGAAVMVGHLDVPGLTTPNVPASISPEVMRLLREGSGYGAAPFNGPIFTDDLGGMAAITNRLSIAEAVEAALVAGADNALWISTAALSSVLDRLEQAVRSGKLPMEQVNQSVLRMAKFKGAPLDC